MNHIDLSIITVTYNSEEYIADCILSAQLHAIGINVEHIIVDNGSQDGTVPFIKEHFEKRVRLIELDYNAGFSLGNAIGIKEAQGRYLLFLNPDMKIEKGLLDDMVYWMDKNKEIGLSVCRLLMHTHSPHPFLMPIKIPTLFTFFRSLTGLIPFSVSHNRTTIQEDFNLDELQEIQSARGAFFLLRRSIDLSFDTSFFLLLEDLDLCRNVQRAGYKVVYYPHLTCIDFYNRSFLTKTVPWYYLIGSKAIRTYVSKWYGKWHLLWLIPLSWVGFLCRIPGWGIKESFKAYKNYRSCILTHSHMKAKR